MNSNNGRNGRIDALTRREAEVKAAIAALRAEKKRQKELNRETAARVHALLGAAVAADLETATDQNRAVRAYIREVLGRTYGKTSGPRALLEAAGLL
jgi:hypothetical protein